jgi:hypothetical protein
MGMGCPSGLIYDVETKGPKLPSQMWILMPGDNGCDLLVDLQVRLVQYLVDRRRCYCILNRNTLSLMNM